MKQQNYNYIKEVSRIIQLFFNWVNPNVANFIACQSALETAYGRSTIAQENNNIFGMKYPKLRITTAIGESREHAKYLTMSDSIKDYYYWCRMKYPELRITTAIGENMDHAKYLTMSDSIIDYFYWCSYNKMTKLDFMNLEQFKTSTNWLKYCPNQNYLEKIELIYKSFTKHNAYGEQQETRNSKGSEESK